MVIKNFSTILAQLILGGKEMLEPITAITRLPSELAEVNRVFMEILMNPTAWKFSGTVFKLFYRVTQLFPILKKCLSC